MGNAHASNCSDCNHDSNKADRHVIRDGLSFAANIEGDYNIETDDAFVQVSADPDEPDSVPEVALPSASCLESPHHVTVVAVDSDVDVTGTGTAGDETLRIPEGKAVTFWVVDAPAQGCGDGEAYWADNAAPPAP